MLKRRPPREPILGLLLASSMLIAACSPAASPAPTSAPAVPTAAPKPTTAPAAPTTAAAAPTAAPAAPTAAATLVPTPAAAKPAQEVRIGMAFIPNVQFAPFYVADAKGYFAAEGIKPVYDYGFEQDVVALTAQNQLLFTNSGASSTIIARSHGVPVRYFIKEYTSMPIAILALKDKGFSKLTDLKGHSVGISGPFGDTYTGYKIMLDKAGMTDTDVNSINIGFTQVESVLADKVDAAVGYANNEPLVLRAQGKEVTEFDLKDVAPEVAGNGIIASEQTLNQNPELVRGFTRAFLHGLDDTIKNPQEAFDITLKFVPDAAKDDTIKQAQLQVLSLTVSDYLKTPGRLGESDLTQWQKSQDLMKSTGLIDANTDMSQAVSNDFLPPK